MFQTVKLNGETWAVYLVNPDNPSDRYAVSAAFNDKAIADNFRDELLRIASFGGMNE